MEIIKIRAETTETENRKINETQSFFSEKIKQIKL